ncbi:hypothetical protein SLEP1_g13390 [Rubroshorea leprosula]|uniref:DUF295 domain-containing protein n=1 Tax=Rubroshorea leprosula TaxID=152421 RepID=A0AAV5INQ8_9ROSI|nr:hypothetical protein SLEP1_g13390 [Rubroshorea leprosula]
MTKRSREECGDSTGQNIKRRIELPEDLFCPIMKRLPLIDVIRAKVVSHACNSSAASVLSSDSHTRFMKSPWLILPPKQLGEDGYTSMGRGRIMNLEENRVYDLKKTTSDLVSEFGCIGSSHGWLILSDHKSLTPFLFNPFTEARIQLPSLKPLFGIAGIEEGEGDDARTCKILCGDDEWVTVWKQEVRQSFVSKAFLTAEPTGGDFAVVLLCYYNNTEEVLYYKNGGDRSWIQFCGLGVPNFIECCDIMCCGNNLYVLGPGWISTWDLGGDRPEKRRTIEDFLPEESFERPNFFRYRDYLVESNGEILLVFRFVPENNSGITAEIFDVFKLDLEENKGVRVETLGDDRSLFLGQNQSVSISTKDFSRCKGDSIYFTHDTLGFHLYCGTDMGIYSFKDREVSPITQFSSERCLKPDQVPRWLIPSSC